MTDVARPSFRAALAKLPTSTTVRKTRSWSSVGEPGSEDISISSNVTVQIIPVFRTATPPYMAVQHDHDQKSSTGVIHEENNFEPSKQKSQDSHTPAKSRPGLLRRRYRFDMFGWRGYRRSLLPPGDGPRTWNGRTASHAYT